MNAATKSSARAYNNSRDLFQEIKDLFESLEKANASVRPSVIKDIIYNLNDLKSESKRIKLTLLSSHFNEETMYEVEHNLLVFRKQGDYLRRKIMSIKFYYEILPNINKYIHNVITTLDDDEKRKFGTNPKDLKKIFLSKILNPNKVETFKLKLNQLVQSTMSSKMFSNIFKGIMYNKKIRDTKISPSEYAKKFGHPEAHQRARDEFQSLKKYKKQAIEKAANVKFRKK